MNPSSSANPCIPCLANMGLAWNSGNMVYLIRDFIFKEFDLVLGNLWKDRQKLSNDFDLTFCFFCLRPTKYIPRAADSESGP